MNRELLPGVPWIKSASFDEHFLDTDPEPPRAARQLCDQGFGVLDFPDGEIDVLAWRDTLRWSW